MGDGVGAEQIELIRTHAKPGPELQESQHHVTHAQSLAHTHTHALTHTHTRAHTHTHTHTHARSLARSLAHTHTHTQSRTHLALVRSCRYVERHRAALLAGGLSPQELPLVAEPISHMRGSYAMVDAAGR